MKTINIKLADGQIAKMQMSDEQYESFKEIQRPYWREEKRKQRRGLSLEQFIEENNFDIADDSQNPEAVFCSREYEDERQKELQLKKLRQGLKTLTDKQANAIHKHFFNRMTYEEIAEEEQVDKYTIRDRIQVALKKLKKILLKHTPLNPVFVQTYERIFSLSVFEVSKIKFFEETVEVRQGAIKEFLCEHGVSESCLSGGLYLNEDRLNFILTTDSVDLIDAKMLTRFCYRKNIDGILEFADDRQRRYVIKQARAW